MLFGNVELNLKVDALMYVVDTYQC